MIFLLESVDLCHGVVLDAHFGEGSYEVSFESIIRLFCLRFQSLKPRQSLTLQCQAKAFYLGMSVCDLLRMYGLPEGSHVVIWVTRSVILLH